MRQSQFGSITAPHGEREAAIDLDPDHNGLKTSWPVAANMPIEVMEEFAREGWIGLGWQIGRDSMHFQPTR